MNKLLAAAFAATLATPAAASGCWDDQTAEAIAVRVLQSELTVGAIACDLKQDYAAFVETQRPTLRRHGEVLVAHYEHAYGTEAPRRLDALVTRLVNEASSRKSDWIAGYCTFVTALTRRAIGAEDAELGRLALGQPSSRQEIARNRCVAG